MLGTITAFIKGSPILFYSGLAILALIGTMYLRISYLTHDRDNLIGHLAVATANLELCRQVNTQNIVNVGILADKLNTCIMRNVVAEDKAKQAAIDHIKSLQELNVLMDQEKKKMREALQNETCAMVAIPSDVERVLRDGAARANGISRDH